MRQDAEVIMKLTDADNAADGIFFPALEQNMMGAVLINEKDEVMFFNPAAEKLWGYKREEVIGNNIDMLIPRDLRPAHPEYIRHNRHAPAEDFHLLPQSQCLPCGQSVRQHRYLPKN